MFGSEDLFGEVLGGIGNGRREARLNSWLNSHCLPALKTELGTGGELRAALSAAESKTSSALQAKFGLSRIVVLTLRTTHQPNSLSSASALSNHNPISISRIIATPAARCVLAFW
jgi:hypothetical protein